MWLCQEVAGLGAPLFALFEHPAPRLLDGVALMMRAVAEGGVLAATPMREAALAEGSLLSHLLLATTQPVNFSYVCQPMCISRVAPAKQLNDHVHRLFTSSFAGPILLSQQAAFTAFLVLALLLLLAPSEQQLPRRTNGCR